MGAGNPKRKGEGWKKGLSLRPGGTGGSKDQENVDLDIRSRMAKGAISKKGKKGRKRCVGTG